MVDDLRSHEEARIELTFDHRLGDHLAAERLYYTTTFFYKADKVVAVLLALFGVYLVWAVGPRWWALIWFPLALLEWWNLLSLRPLQIAYGFRTNPKFRETYHLSLDPSGIQFQTASIDSKIKWDFYSRMLENARLCLLVYGSHMYTVIPKRAFKDDAELNQFRALVSESVGKGTAATRGADSATVKASPPRQ